jgi:predicted O-methyltransferase YrrM
MSSKAFAVTSYLRFLVRSGTRHAVHSPFVYTLVDQVLRSTEPCPDFDTIRSLRRRLMASKQEFEVADFGEGREGRNFSFHFESVSALVKRSAVNEKYGQTLYRLTSHFKPKVMLELGTSVGMSAIYLAMGNPQGTLITIEGCTTKSERATANLKSVGITNVEQHIGRFDVVLPEVLQAAGKVDFAFIDGNHNYRATLSYFRKILEYSGNDTVLVFDDIHWSRGMEEAWTEITNHERVTVSVDLFRLGIVFLKKELSPQKFVIRY